MEPPPTGAAGFRKYYILNPYQVLLPAAAAAAEHEGSIRCKMNKQTSERKHNGMQPGLVGYDVGLRAIRLGGSLKMYESGLFSFFF